MASFVFVLFCFWCFLCILTLSHVCVCVCVWWDHRTWDSGHSLEGWNLNHPDPRQRHLCDDGTHQQGHHRHTRRCAWWPLFFVFLFFLLATPPWWTAVCLFVWLIDWLNRHLTALYLSVVGLCSVGQRRVDSIDRHSFFGAGRKATRGQRISPPPSPLCATTTYQFGVCVCVCVCDLLRLGLFVGFLTSSLMMGNDDDDDGQWWWWWWAGAICGLHGPLQVVSALPNIWSGQFQQPQPTRHHPQIWRRLGLTINWSLFLLSSPFLLFLFFSFRSSPSGSSPHHRGLWAWRTTITITLFSLSFSPLTFDVLTHTHTLTHIHQPAGDIDHVNVENPGYDYVPPELVSLFVTNL